MEFSCDMVHSVAYPRVNAYDTFRQLIRVLSNTDIHTLSALISTTIPTYHFAASCYQTFSHVSDFYRLSMAVLSQQQPSRLRQTLLHQSQSQSHELFLPLTLSRRTLRHHQPLILFMLTIILCIIRAIMPAACAVTSG
jgi:hypothetical protein